MIPPIPTVLAPVLELLTVTGLLGLSFLVISMTAPPVSYGNDPLGCFDLLKAAQHNDSAVLRRALQASVPVDCRNDQQQTPLLVATMYNSVDAARLLIEAGADVNAQDDRQDSPLLYAAADGRLEILALILKARPNFAVYNRFGGTALIPACERGHVEVVRALLTTVVDINHVNQLGWTGLLEAIILGQGGPRHQEIVRLLIEAGTNLNLADRDGVTPLQHARRKRQHEIARMLEEAGAR